jgi:hypothetical protein
MADDGQEWDIAVAVAAEPAECSRRFLVYLVGFVSISCFAVFGGMMCYSIDVLEHRYQPHSRLPIHVALILLFLSVPMLMGSSGLFCSLLEERNLGNPEGRRLVDTLLLL